MSARPRGLAIMADQGAYRLVYSQVVAQRLKELAEQAVRTGFGQEFVAALKAILRILAENPLEWGDPHYRLRALDLLVCHGIHSFLHVRYAVDEERKIVYIMETSPLPNHPLSQGP